MTDERTRGIVLYALTALVLAGGGVWFVRSAPETRLDPRMAAWRRTAERRLPDVPLQALSDTVELRGGLSTERNVPIEGGSYSLSMICAGTGKVRVRMSTGGNDSGLAVECSDEPSPQNIKVALADSFYLQVDAEDDQGGAVFRWRLQRSNRY